MARTCTIVWTPSGLAAVTLCDLSAGWFPTFEQWPKDAVEQEDRLAFGASVFRCMRGNVSGQMVFKVDHSFDSPDDAAAWWQTVEDLHAASAVAGNGNLTVTIGGTAWSYSGATFKRPEPVLMNAQQWTLRYTFGVVTRDPPVTDPG